MPTHHPPKTLPSAGESLQRKANEHTNYYFYATGTIFGLWFVVVAAWILKLFDRSLDPITITVVAMGVTLILWMEFRRKIFPELRKLWRGASGERAVADTLHELGKDGYIAIHDIERDRDGRYWNIDHVLIGPAGIFVIETKWRAKETSIVFDGTHVRENGHQSGCVAQACRNADEIRQLIQPHYPNVPIRPVVLYPGIWVQPKSSAHAWVLNPKQLHAWLRQESRNVSPVNRETVRAVYELIADKARRPVNA